MKVDINLSRDVKEPYVVIHTNEITNEISELANTISEISEKGSTGRIIGNAEDTMIILEPETISVIRVDNEKVFVVSDGVSYRVNKRMYELLEVSSRDICTPSYAFRYWYSGFPLPAMLRPMLVACVVKTVAICGTCFCR